MRRLWPLAAALLLVAAHLIHGLPRPAALDGAAGGFPAPGWLTAIAALLALLLIARRGAPHRDDSPAMPGPPAPVVPSEELLGRLVASMGEAVLIFGEDRRILFCNGAAAQLLGVAPARVCGADVADLLRPVEPLRMAREGGVRELRLRRSGGAEAAVEVALSGSEVDGHWLGVALLRDITVRAVRQAELERMALHDALTGLPNRTLLNDRIAHAIGAARRNGECTALLLLDLDRFKEVNDTLGHQIGDRLLQQIGPRLRAPLRDTDTVARLGGDEFAILLPPPTTLETACRVGERVVEAFSHPFAIDDLVLEVGVSIGVGLCPDHAVDPATLLHAADVAMYTAKRGQLGFVVYSAGSEMTQVRELTLTGELRRAIEGNELSLDFQPKICASTGRVVGAEALLRWRHPVHGAIPPEAFIRSADQTGLLKRLTHWILNAALEELQTLRRQGHELSMAVNLSAKSLRFLLKAWEVPPELLILEITENALMADPAITLDVLGRVAAIGCRLSLDDFGTGYSSLAHLQRLPIGEIKIDRSFVAAMTGDPNAATIVRSVVRLAKALDLSVVAEGVETEDAFAWLRALGCDELQGHHFAAAMNRQQFRHWLREAPTFATPDWTSSPAVAQASAR